MVKKGRPAAVSWTEQRAGRTDSGMAPFGLYLLSFDPGYSLTRQCFPPSWTSSSLWPENMSRYLTGRVETKTGSLTVPARHISPPAGSTVEPAVARSFAVNGCSKQPPRYRLNSRLAMAKFAFNTLPDDDTQPARPHVLCLVRVRSKCHHLVWATGRREPSLTLTYCFLNFCNRIIPSVSRRI